MTDRDPRLKDINEVHHWSGWPGAFCMKCRCEDPYEIALADGKLMATDHNTIEPIDEATAVQLDEQSICPVKGALHYEENIWYLIKPDGERVAMYDMSKGKNNDQ